MKEYWYIPCNIKFCDVISILDDDGYIVWRRGASVHKGDVAYIYVGAPFAEIMYKCEVIEDDITQESLGENHYAIRMDDLQNQRYMKLKKVFKYESNTLPFGLLKEKGLSQWQRQARNGKELQSFLDEVDKSYGA